MKYMHTSLAFNIRHRLLRRVRWRLVHDDHQMPFLMVLQHLPQESDHFLRTDALFVQLEKKPAGTIDGGNRRHSSSLARYLLTRRQATRGPRLTQKGCQRNIGLILEIQQSPVFLHGFADSRGLRLHPFLTDFLVHFKVLSLRLLVGQPSIPQTPPDGIVRNRCRIFLLDNLMQSTNGPQVRFKTEGRRRLKNDFPKSRLVKAFEQTRAATYLPSLEPIQATYTVSGHPSKKCRSINTKRVCNLADSQAPFDSLHCSNTNIKGRVPSLAHDHKRTTFVSCVSRPICCRTSATGHSNAGVMALKAKLPKVRIFH